MKNNSENENYRYIVFISNEDNGYYEVYYDDKPHNRIDDIVAIVKSEQKAKDLCKNDPKLEYKKIQWED
jgi:hypothetical protein